MDWKPEMWKFNIKPGKDKWLILLALGLICLILAFPTDGSFFGRNRKSSLGIAERSGMESMTEGLTENSAADRVENSSGTSLNSGSGRVSEEEDALTQASAKAAVSYEQQLENRLKDLLSHVDGVGEVEVMIVLKSSEEKVWRVDRNSSSSITKETDSNGGTRDIQSQEISENTIMAGQSGTQEPFLEKEIKPEIGGVVVSAAGGGSPTVQAEISAAVEALFDVPSHKIKVLKRVE